ncbi:MAG TPA: ImmA/IrrE family metallo-endopeptidase, partial [Thermoanaerobacterales bacterium]|nr:ImmA/IrrE family metallo-endopeptidase [Thermoanaerobacterales bacterium]
MRADYAAAVRESVNVLIDHEFDIIPIDLDRIFEDLSRTIKKYSYSELAAKYDVTISFICDYFESDLGACAYLADREQYIIVYNDTKFNYGLDRFTIAHELGHFFLNHYAQVESNVLLRKRMPERKYKKFENEANCFARNLLAPVPLVERIIELDSPLSIQELQDAFNISYQAAKTRKGLFQADRYRMQTDYYTYFNGYEINFGYYCVSCGNAEIEASNFCKICGEVASIFDKTHNRTFYEGFALD